MRLPDCTSGLTWVCRCARRVLGARNYSAHAEAFCLPTCAPTCWEWFCSDTIPCLGVCPPARRRVERIISSTLSICPAFAHARADGLGVVRSLLAGICRVFPRAPTCWESWPTTGRTTRPRFSTRAPACWERRAALKIGLAGGGFPKCARRVLGGMNLTGLVRPPFARMLLSGSARNSGE